MFSRAAYPDWRLIVSAVLAAIREAMDGKVFVEHALVATHAPKARRTRP
ncbi:MULTISPECIES: hypothetical protein [Halomonadaceae]|jgi:hypothetical protein|uniref:Uncharacterized protein n=3 Tax=Vreelandella TaxID=3137766 RepID=A0A7Z0LVF2_9GAMM|nr:MULTISPECIES: hypothetical protein [Halomonas]AJY53040.1 hypothetical protein KO116_P100290 [Halomonas sp. KO116]NVF16056.1 hypothetical protein [Halomonas maris]NYS79417.1 hypothetical protein [Halomonas glaciei]